MSKTWKFSIRKIEKGEAFVEIGGGSQLAQVIRQTRRYRQDGYDVLPLNSGTGDAHGVYTQFVPEIFAHPADMTRWEKPTAERAYWRKIRPVPAQRASDDGDATGGGPYTPGSAIEEFGGDE